MVAYTTTYNLKKPTVADDEDVWGGYLNDSMDLIDDVLDGTTPVTGIDINSGTIDNAVIGGTTPVAGTFTTLSATTSLGVTGNITVSGTVDGRDVSADGAKLDGIESGATADQTKSDIDALGIAASTAATLATARNIALTGAVTGNVNFDGSGNVSIATTATSDPTLTLSGDASGSATFTNLGNATLSVTVADDSHNHVISNVDGLQTALDAKVESLSDLSVTASAVELNYNDITTLGTVEAGKTVTADSPTGDVNWPDGKKAKFGNSGDLQIYHNGSDSQIWDLGTGDLKITGYANVKVLAGITQENMANFAANGAVTLYYDNSSKFETTSGGAQINGTLFVQGSVAEDYDALSGTSPTCNVDNGGAFSLTMSGNTTFTFSGADSGYSQGFILQLTGNGSTVTWPASVDWAGGTAPDAPASGETDIYVFWTRDGGTTWYGVQSIDAAA